MYDVAIIGAGPAGAATARHCAGAGLKTIIIERHKLPRSKCCGGLLWPETIELLEREFGEIPKKLIINELKGNLIHTSAGSSIQPPHRIINTWRSELDYWLTEEATKVGADLWESSLFQSMSEEGDKLVLTLRKEKKEAKLEAKIVVGCDGSPSTVRRAIYPEVNLDQYMRHSYRPHYRGTVDIDLNYLHMWLDLKMGVDYASVVPKGGDLFIFSSQATPGEDIKKKSEHMREYMANNHGFRGEFQYAEGCTTFNFLLSRGAMLGKGNVILAGDACGLNREYGEGIFCGTTSGIEASKAVRDAIATGKPAAEIYPAYVEGVVEEAKQSLRAWQQRRAGLMGTPL